MNCEEARQKIKIRTILESFNLFPVKENRKTAFYFALDREETVPSLSVDFVKNTAFDFGTGKNYDVISLVQQMNKCSVSEALKYLLSFNIPVFRNVDVKMITEVKNYQIIKVSEIRHLALIQYLKSREVFEQKHLVEEILYRLDGKTLFAIGFLNNSGGYEIRNKYTKICLGQKDVTWVKNEPNVNNEVLIFEGFFDYLAYRNMTREESSKADYLILNSTALLFKVRDALNEYDLISLFLDNDTNGRLTKETIQMNYEKVEDCSLIYSDFKDMNEWFCNYRR
ncbi:toprim domain-containing protein [Chryseobacterium turcicum]|uniref:Toprim domain-containing protein n=1 Tax=Chryseobacterium turcicum TaxID=2898076 RepID=A0A9Q3V595_9FLAO|nr:toprim domain-containing protein [Chryseobacterium turcicum]MCD1117531.1 toprim domain-containing protein [Chryseobacterium turcicum]